jgi:quinoprotein dehydrogenase-associated probable ABC transporter substrate-binding protein
MPFSNLRGEGFDNKIAQLIARDLHRPLEFVWMPEQSRFVEKRIKAGQCDLLMGVPAGFDLMLVSVPYYKSRYMFVARSDRKLHLHSLRDPSLRRMRIGIHLLEDDYVPPAHELMLNGMRENLVGYPIRGNPLSKDPSANVVRAVADGAVDVAVVWGPTAGYFAAQSTEPLSVSAICSSGDTRALPLAFAMSIGVRRNDPELLRAVNRAVLRERQTIRQLLRVYNVPGANTAAAGSACR